MRLTVVSYILASGLLTLAATGKAAEAPKFIPDGQGGYRLTFLAEHFVNTRNGSLDHGVYVVPRTATYRDCLLYTPSIPIPHGGGYLRATITMKARFVGFVNPVEGEDPDIFAAHIIVGQGNDTRRDRNFFHTGLMEKISDYVESPTSIHIIANTRGFVRFDLSEIAVDQDDRAYVTVCGMSPGSSAEFKEITIHTYPSQQGSGP